MKRKKNFRKIPNIVIVKLNGINGDVLVATILSMTKAQILDDTYKNLGIKIVNEEVQFLTEFIPDPSIGRYSKRNVEGKSTPLKDLPKILKTIDLGERYPYGDTSRIPFNMYVDRMVYQQKIEEPRNNSLKVELLNDDNNNFSFKISVNEVLRKEDPNFNEDLLFNLNLLQESAESSDVYRSDTTKEEFLASLNVTWEFLPPGTRDQNLESILSEVKVLTLSLRNEIIDKYDFLNNLNPLNIIKGSSGMIRYFGMMFREDLVVFETLNYGNALYVMYDNWADLSTISRIQLLNKESRDFDRVVHKGKWKERIVELIANKLNAA